MFLLLGRVTVQIYAVHVSACNSVCACVLAHATMENNVQCAVLIKAQSRQHASVLR